MGDVQTLEGLEQRCCDAEVRETGPESTGAASSTAEISSARLAAWGSLGTTGLRGRESTAAGWSSAIEGEEGKETSNIQKLQQHRTRRPSRPGLLQGDSGGTTMRK
jgi:hypothetical protein